MAVVHPAHVADSKASVVVQAKAAQARVDQARASLVADQAKGLQAAVAQVVRVQVAEAQVKADLARAVQARVDRAKVVLVFPLEAMANRVSARVAHPVLPAEFANTSQVG